MYWVDVADNPQAAACWTHRDACTQWLGSQCFLPLTESLCGKKDDKSRRQLQTLLLAQTPAQAAAREGQHGGPSRSAGYPDTRTRGHGHEDTEQLGYLDLGDEEQGRGSGAVMLRRSLQANEPTCEELVHRIYGNASFMDFKWWQRHDTYPCFYIIPLADKYARGMYTGPSTTALFPRPIPPSFPSTRSSFPLVFGCSNVACQPPVGRGTHV